MPMTGPASHVPTAEEFSGHWAAADTTLGVGPERRSEKWRGASFGGWAVPTHRQMLWCAQPTLLFPDRLSDSHTHPPLLDAPIQSV
jgi:hypothetical protein